MTIAVLVASVQCLSACALVSCELVSASQTPPAPPCHQHPQTPAPRAGHPCDHQQAVSFASSDMPLPDMALLPAALPAQQMVAGLSSPTSSFVLESPPGLAVSSVLRI